MKRESLKVAVLGAGMTGLTAARRLTVAGDTVVVFEKSRGAGGRMSTRRAGSWRFDHGAQFVTSHSQEFSKTLTHWERSGVVSEWAPRMATLDGSPTWRPERPWYVGVPGMNAMTRNLATGFVVRYGTCIERLMRAEPGWFLVTDTGDTVGPFDQLVIAIPLPQAAVLTREFGALALTGGPHRIRPCWAVMVGFEHPLEVPFDVGTAETGPLTWTARNSSKPGRPEGDAWVLHADHNWSRNHVGLPSEEVARILLRSWSNSLGRDLPPVVHRAGHLWRYALPEPSAGPLIRTDGELGLVVAGDGLHHGRVEAAYRSGSEAASFLRRIRPLPVKKRAGKTIPEF